MDQLDQNLIGRLRLNARESVAELARQLNTSRSTVQDRLTRLEKNGVIKGYVVNLDEATHGQRIRSFISISIGAQNAGMITAELKTFHNVNAIYTVSGKFDLMVEIGTNETSDMDKILDRICEIPGVIKTETSIVLSTKLQR